MSEALIEMLKIQRNQALDALAQTLAELVSLRREIDKAKEATKPAPNADL
jgi:hypothetical protein